MPGPARRPPPPPFRNSILGRGRPIVRQHKAKVFATVSPATINAVASLDAISINSTVVVSTVAGSTTIDAITLNAFVAVDTIAATASVTDLPVVLTTEFSKWMFYDPETDSRYSFEISPDKGTPVRRKNLVYQNTFAPTGRTLAYEAGRTTEFSWSGTIITEDEYNSFVEWFNKRNPITVIDDLGRSYLVYLTEFNPKRERKQSTPWFHTYDMHASVVS